jgi:putative membrane protein
MSFIIIWIVSAVSLIIISRLNVGIYVSDFGQALIAALVIGLINAILGPIAELLALPLIWLTLGLFRLVINALLFWLAASIVKGFSLSNGFWSALIGSVLLTIINMVLFWLLGIASIT